MLWAPPDLASWSTGSRLDRPRPRLAVPTAAPKNVDNGATTTPVIGGKGPTELFHTPKLAPTTAPASAPPATPHRVRNSFCQPAMAPPTAPMINSARHRSHRRVRPIDEAPAQRGITSRASDRSPKAEPPETNAATGGPATHSRAKKRIGLLRARHTDHTPRERLVPVRFP